ncbi:MAG: type I-F CRISPR-associated protein Csy3 [Alteromonadaceae bacterium]|nr:MAG: type I-F CRISPR-associated protein Csy3 [Alteromonadaceae bacterium]
MAEAKLKTPSVLAFEAKLLPSDALMFSGQWGNRNAANWAPIMVSEKSVRGTISNRLKSALLNDTQKLDTEVSKANIQTVDIAALPLDCDTLKVSFTLRVLGDLAIPSTCNSPAYQSALKTCIDAYAEETDFSELALRYAYNIANGRFLWRNRVGAEEVEVVVSSADQSWQFSSLDIGLRDFSSDNSDIKALAKVVETGLRGDGYALLTVNAYTKLGQGQAVYPSQELVMGGGKGDKSKFLYQLNGQAAMHSQKIGNAVRTIDTWHPAADDVGPIAVEPYGSVTNRGVAYRQPKEGTDFYKLLDGWLLKGREPALEQKHYIMAMLIRGGVFGE